MTDNQKNQKSLVEELTESSAAMETAAQNPISQPEPSPEPEQPVENAEEVEEQEQPLTNREQNFRQLREERERLARERDEALRYAAAIEQEAYRLAQQQQRPVPQQEPEYDVNALSDDDLVDGRAIKKILATESKKRRDLEQNMARSQQAAYEAAVTAQLKAQYPDFDAVLTPQNVAALREARPGLARSLAANPDLAEKARETYHILKDLGIYQSAQPEIRPNVQRNMTKPRSSQSVAPQVGENPLNAANMFANGLTPELKQALWADMQKKRSSW